MDELFLSVHHVSNTRYTAATTQDTMSAILATLQLPLNKPCQQYSLHCSLQIMLYHGSVQHACPFPERTQRLSVKRRGDTAGSTVLIDSLTLSWCSTLLRWKEPSVHRSPAGKKTRYSKEQRENRSPLKGEDEVTLNKRK